LSERRHELGFLPMRSKVVELVITELGKPGVVPDLGLKGKIRNWTVSLLVLTSKSISTLNLK
jgi:hypothetical protein